MEERQARVWLARWIASYLAARARRSFWGKIRQSSRGKIGWYGAIPFSGSMVLGAWAVEPLCGTLAYIVTILVGLAVAFTTKPTIKVTMEYWGRRRFYVGGRYSSFHHAQEMVGRLHHLTPGELLLLAEVRQLVSQGLGVTDTRLITDRLHQATHLPNLSHLKPLFREIAEDFQASG